MVKNNGPERREKIALWTAIGPWTAIGDGPLTGYFVYVANDESPSQHVTVGLAEARPNHSPTMMLTSTLPSSKRAAS